MGEILRRFLSAVAMITFALTMKLYCVETLISFYTILTIVCLFEYHYKINTPRKTTTIIISLGIYGLLIWNTIDPENSYKITLIIPLIMTLFGVELFFGISNPLLNIGTDLIGIVWICFPMFLCIKICLKDGIHDIRLIAGCMVMIWFNDAGAYLIGKAIGKTPLFRRISPNKTWEGSIGGAIIASICWLIISYFFKFLTQKEWAGILVISVICGCVGDLIESMFKRDLKIKDTSSILPGHGGVLDRVDAILYAIPAIYYYLDVIGY